MDIFNIKILDFTSDSLSFEWAREKILLHYFIFIVPISIGLFLLLLRLIFEPVITFFGLILSIIAFTLIIIGIVFLSSTTTRFQIHFQFKSLKITIEKTQIKFFSRKSTRSYTGMVLEIPKTPPSLIKWSKFFPIDGSKIIIYKSEVMNNDFDLNWNLFFGIIHKRLLLSKRLPNVNNK